MAESPVHSASKHVYYASSIGARLDSDVWRGGGTDDTAALQAVLDKAPELGHLHLVMDGAALVRGLTIHSNTTVECLNPDCGFFLASGSNAPILINAHPSREERLDLNITLLGGTYNQNCMNQEHHLPDGTLVVALGFFGVECLTVRDVTIRNQRTYAAFITNWRRVTMENIYIDLPDRIHGGNQDGIHFQGPGEFLVMRNIQGCSWDDFIAINADDVNCEVDEEGRLVGNEKLGPYPSFGPIADVLIDGVLLEDAAQGIRILSRASRVDRIIVRNVTGTYRSFGFYINPFLVDGGDFGHIIFDTIDLRHGEPNYRYAPPLLFSLGGRMDSFTVSNLFHHEPADNRPLIHVMKNAELKALTVNGLEVSESGSQAADARYIQVEGRVEDLTIRGAQLRRGKDVPVDGCLVEVGSADGAPVVDRLFLDGISVRRMKCLVSQKSGDIGALQMNSILAEDLESALVNQRGGTIGQVRADAVHGAEVLERAVDEDNGMSE